MAKNVKNVVEENVEETEVTEVTETNEEPKNEPEVKESKLKKVWLKIKKPAGYVGVLAGGIILGNIIAGRRAEEDVDLDLFENVNDDDDSEE